MSAFGIGVPELVIIFIVALLVFGPGKLPELGANVGKAIRDFRKATSDITSEFTREVTIPEPPAPQQTKADNSENKGEGEQNTTSPGV